MFNKEIKQELQNLTTRVESLEKKIRLKTLEENFRAAGDLSLNRFIDVFEKYVIDDVTGVFKDVLKANGIIIKAVSSPLFRFFGAPSFYIWFNGHEFEVSFETKIKDLANCLKAKGSSLNDILEQHKAKRQVLNEGIKKYNANIKKAKKGKVKNAV